MRIAKNARDLRHESGVLASPDPKKGKCLPGSTVEKIVEYYTSDENSRVMPNKKDVVRVKEGNNVIHVPKRLLLSDIKVLHQNFKAQYPEMQISFSMFAKLRPPYCVIAGARGTHTVCVCVIHHNFKAMFEASCLIQMTKGSTHDLQSYADCIMYCLCRNPKPDCHLGNCLKCPKLSDFEEYTISTLLENDVGEVTFSTWKATDRCTLKKECLDVHDFAHELAQSLEKLIPHHFISKKQSGFITHLKGNIKENEGVLEIDYSENYAYVAQNAAQQFHYNNDQCSIFGAILHYREEEDVKHFSFVVLSQCTTHDTTAVYVSQTQL